jgi:transcriptional regulator with XRE-family HTH domain
MTIYSMLTPDNKIPLGAFFKQKREEKGLLVRQVAAVTELDQAIISRIENGDRLPTKEQVLKLAGLYNLDARETMARWLADRMLREYGAEPYAPEAFREVHEHMNSNSLTPPEWERYYKPNFDKSLFGKRNENREKPDPGDTKNSPGSS